jgi:hypothetical protein
MAGANYLIIFITSTKMSFVLPRASEKERGRRTKNVSDFSMAVGREMKIWKK